MRRTGAICCVTILFAGCGFDSSRPKAPSPFVAPDYSQPDLHRTQIDAVRREAAERAAGKDAPGAARASSLRVGASISSDPPATTRKPLGSPQPWDETDFD